MEFLIAWVIFAVIIGAIASDKAMGFWGGFFWSILLSPVIALLIVVLSKSKQQQQTENQMAYNQTQQTALLHQMQQKDQAPQKSVADELEKLKKQMDDGIITPDEFQKLKSRLIA